MDTGLVAPHGVSQSKLACPACGHKDRFIEVMESEAHLVDANRDYIKLIEGVVDHYICFACGKSFDIDW
jgi:DNA-directed RNA polymerase subunit RPC12/RpoP